VLRKIYVRGARLPKRKVGSLQSSLTLCRFGLELGTRCRRLWLSSGVAAMLLQIHLGWRLICCSMLTLLRIHWISGFARRRLHLMFANTRRVDCIPLVTTQTFKFCNTVTINARALAYRSFNNVRFTSRV